MNGTNSETCGDYITDTPADPGSLRDYMALQNAVDCEWSNNTLKDENDELYDPDETQIMSYTYPQCMQGFSCMQGIRMRQTIAASSLLQACILSNYVNVQGGVFNAGSYNFYASKDIIVGDITEITGSARVSLRSFGSIYVNPETVIELNDNGSFSAMASSLTLSTPGSSSDMLLS